MKTFACGLALLLSSFCSPANAAQLLQNGGFEAGLEGWMVFGNPFSSFFVLHGTTTPLSGLTTVGPDTGSSYAAFDGVGPGGVLIQSFTVAPASLAVLSFSMFVNNYGENFPVGRNQLARADILAAGASAFDTGAGVLGNFYLGSDPGMNPHGYTNRMFDITSLVGGGGTFQLRFEVQNDVHFLTQGVDSVRIESTGANAVPEPASLTLIALGLGLLTLLRARRRSAFHSHRSPDLIVTA